MLYAWRLDEKDKKDLSRRINAQDYPGKEAVCPLHGCRVVSRKLNGVWQWVHEEASHLLDKPRCRKGK